MNTNTITFCDMTRAYLPPSQALTPGVGVGVRADEISSDAAHHHARLGRPQHLGAEHVSAGTSAGVGPEAREFIGKVAHDSVPP